MQAAKHNKRLLFVLLTATVIVVMGLVGISAAIAQDGGGACSGTYYVNINSGDSYALWTFNQDGTFQGTDTAETVFDFSHSQGAWKHTTASRARGRWIDFAYGLQPAPVAVVDADLEFGNNCQEFDGIFELRFFGFNEYPFSVDAQPPFFGGSFFGQRINP